MVAVSLGYRGRGQGFGIEPQHIGADRSGWQPRIINADGPWQAGKAERDTWEHDHWPGVLCVGTAGLSATCVAKSKASALRSAGLRQIARCPVVRQQPSLLRQVNDRESSPGRLPDRRALFRGSMAPHVRKHFTANALRYGLCHLTAPDRLPNVNVSYIHMR